MRKLIGSIVLLGGVGTLGYVGTTQHAASIQTAIGDDARAIATTAPLGVQTTVSGRDLIVTGRVMDATERAVLQAGFEGIDGMRSVDINGVEALPIADPFQMQISRSVEGALSVDGVLPSNAARTVLNNAAFDDVPLAAGVPDGAWVDALQTGFAALGHMNDGQMTLTNRTLTLVGAARVPADHDAILATLESPPTGYEFKNQVIVLDDGTPFRLFANLRDGGVDVAGKFPSDLSTNIVTERVSVFETFEITSSALTSPLDDWGSAVETGLDALVGLIEAELLIEDTHISLTGVGSPDAISQAETLLAGLADTYDVATDLGVYGADFELVLTMTWDGSGANAEGIYPLDFTPRGPAGVTVSDAGRVLFLPDDIGAFTANANAGVAALELLDSGTLSATDTSITLTGEAVSPQVSGLLEEVLTNAAEGTEVSREVAYLDDGSPAAWSLVYDVESGARIDGRLPNGLDAAAVGQAIGANQILGTPGTAREDSNIGSSLESFEILSGYLREIETLSFSSDSSGSELDLVLRIGANVDLVAVELAEYLPRDVSFSLSVMDPPPEDGTVRMNALSRSEEAFSNGFWIPTTAFAADASECGAQTLNVFERGKIGFLSSSARFDATSTSTVNALAAVALACVDAGLTFEVGGHTDSTGSALANEVLSTNRANSVRTALIERGVPATVVTAFGYGQSEPIADNETAEGRAANRRTDVTWSEASAEDTQ